MGVRIIICGGRDFGDAMMLSFVLSQVHGKRTIVEIIHGCEPGADLMGDWWARQNGIKVTPDWETHGQAAGAARDQQMLALDPDGVVAFPSGHETADLVNAAREREIPVLMAEKLWGKRP